MTSKKPKPIVIIYEVPHIRKLQNDLLKLRDDFKKAGWKVIINNPQPYTSDQIIKNAQLCVVYSSEIANAKTIIQDYTDANIDVMNYQEVVASLKPKPKSKPVSNKDLKKGEKVK